MKRERNTKKKKKKLTLGEIRALSASLKIIGILLMVFSGYFDLSFLSIVGIVLTLSGFFVPMSGWKCPFCRAALPTRGAFYMKNCPYCGNRLPTL